MQIGSSLSSVSGYGAMRAAFGRQNMDEMDSKLATDIMSARDTDKSGGLSTSELGTSAEKLAEYDTDGDGQITTSELQAGLKAKREKMQSGMQNQLMQDGQMGMLQAGMGGIQGMDMSKMDTKMARNIISEKDANEDGALSAAELGVSADNLSTIDSDGDGSVSEAELTASLKTHREEMMAENGGQMPPPPRGAEGMGGAQGGPSIDNLVSSLFGESDSDSEAGSDTTLTGASVKSLAEYMQRQKASSSYMNMDRLIADLFGDSGQSEQALSLSA